MGFPSYAELPRPAGEMLPLAWGVFGEDDRIGTWNHVTDAKVAEAARLIRTGRRFNLNLPLHLPFALLPPGTHWLRNAPAHEIFEGAAAVLFCDDHLSFHPQGSTQWDGLNHVGDRKHGFYNGGTIEDVRRFGAEPSGIETLAGFGLATRAVLIDLPRHFAATGRRWATDESIAASADDLRAALDRTATTLEAGDVLLVRTGWLANFLAAGPAEREAIFRGQKYSGISGQEDMWAFLWDNKVAAVAADNLAVEACPMDIEHVMLHLAIARLGITLGEYFVLGELADYAAETGRYDFFFASGPLSLRAGIGSSPNAMAIA
jgi:hypothetical protein